MRTRHHRKLWLTCCMIAAGFALMGCRENETNRVVHFEKGAYPGGAPTMPISEEVLGEMRHRMKQIQSYY